MRLVIRQWDWLDWMYIQVAAVALAVAALSVSVLVQTNQAKAEVRERVGFSVSWRHATPAEQRAWIERQQAVESAGDR